MVNQEGNIPLLKSRSDVDIQWLVNWRSEARKRGDYAAADQVRSELDAANVGLVDEKGGKTRWFRR